MKKPQRKIKNPCPISWDAMDLKDDSTQRFCRVCEKTVFDITAKSNDEVDELYFSNGGNICVSARMSQLNQELPKRRNFRRLLQKGKVAGLIVASSLFVQDLIAQQGQFLADSFKIISQETSNSDCILLEGVIRGERKIGSRKVKNAILSFYTKEHLKIEQTLTDKKGRFQIEIDKKILGNVFFISVSAEGYEYFKTSELALKDMNIEILLEEEIETIILGGRYF